MVDQLLWIETILKGSIGIIMLLLPITAARIVGLPHGDGAFWPRLFGAALIGMAAAFALEGATHLKPTITAQGLGLGGAIAINLITVMSLIGTIVFKGVKAKRGIVLLWGMIILLLALILFEIAAA